MASRASGSPGARRSVWVCPSAFAPHVGGIEEAARQLAAEALIRGDDVRVVTHRHPLALPHIDAVDGVPVHRVQFPTPTASLRGAISGLVTFVRALRALRRLPRPDTVHVHGASVQLPVLLVFCAVHRVRLVVTTHGEVAADDHGIYDSSTYLRLALRVSGRRADLLTAVSVAARDSAAAVAPGYRAAAVVPDGVDVRDWDVTPLPAEPVFGAWGRHEDAKGFDLLLDAFAVVRAQLPEARLLVGGDGSRTTALQRRAGDGVEFLGRLDRPGVAALLARCRTVVVPSRYEAFGIVALESMAAGRGVVWSDLPGLRAATGGLGHPVAAEDADALADGMLAAFASPLDPAAARRHAETLTWAAAFDRYLALLDGTPADRTSG